MYLPVDIPTRLFSFAPGTYAFRRFFLLAKVIDSDHCLVYLNIASKHMAMEQNLPDVHTI